MKFCLLAKNLHIGMFWFSIYLWMYQDKHRIQEERIWSLWWAFLYSTGLPLAVLLLYWARLPPAVLGPSVLSKELRLAQLELNLVRLVHKLYLICQEHAYGRQSYSEWVMASRHDNKIKREYFDFLIKMNS